MVEPNTIGVSVAVGATNTKRTGNPAPTAKTATEDSAAWTGRAR